MCIALFIPIRSVFDCEECLPIIPYEDGGVAVSIEFTEAMESVSREVKEAETPIMHAIDVSLFSGFFDSGNVIQDFSRHLYDSEDLLFLVILDYRLRIEIFIH